ncbi:MAG: outer membrane lipoprotein-sorting protein [Spirochaetales bacterium]|nr:outer membrane lipoprotein-sorting protein [Spirochaetales bacterium]
MRKHVPLIVIFLILLSTPICVFAGGEQEAASGDGTQAQFRLTPYTGSDGLEAKQIMEEANSRLLAGDIVADITMTLVNENGSRRVREIAIKSKEDGKLNKTVLHFLSPADVEGTGLLMIESENGETDMWLYLPELKKTRRIVSSGKNDSFMGSDISYSDMEERPPEDYTNNRFEDETVDGEACYVVEAVPANDAVKEDTGYGRIVYWISKEKMTPLQAVFFDVNGNYFKNLRIKEIREFTDTWIPTLIEVEDVKKSHKTIMELKHIEINTNPDDSYFTQQYLKRGA